LPQDQKSVEDIIVFVHGFCGNKSENGLFDEIANHCTNNKIGAILYDWRGIGKSEGDFTRTTLQDHVSDFREVLSWTRNQTSSTANIHALGFSLGAAIIALATREGEKLDKVAYLSPALRPNISMWPRYQNDAIQESLSKYGYFTKPGCGTKVGASLLESLRDTDLGVESFVSDLPLLACWGKADTRIDASHNQNILNHSLKRASWLNYLEVEDASHSLRPGETNWPKVGELISYWFLKKYSESDDQNLSAQWKSM
jgi:pimeloyl-ACP methyl ester carboxylesterase